MRMPSALFSILVPPVIVTLSSAGWAEPFPRTCDEIDAQRCRTVVVIGDTQDIADYESAVDGRFTRSPWLEAMVNWILENRAAENVDFVLQVGDITEHGWWLPMSPGCLNNCEADHCHCPGEVEGEWKVFTAQFKRLEDAGVPFAIVPGNHDNIRNGGGPLDGAGFSDYYSPARLATLPGYLESKTSATSDCTATAWQFSLGPEPVIVLGLPDSDVNPPSETPPDGMSAVARCPAEDPEIDDWATALIQRPEHAEKQVILLHHRLLEANLARRPKWRNTISRRPERFVAGVSGHWSPSTFPFVVERHSRTGALLDVFAPRVDWQDMPLPGMAAPTAASTFAVIRFHLKEREPDQVEARAWSEFFQVRGGVSDDIAPDDGVPLRDYAIRHAGDLGLCPHYAGSSGPDTDGDGRGDACECSDQNLDGSVTVSDVVAINTAIFDPALATPLCDGNGDSLCDVGDIVAANREIFSCASTSICAQPPVPGPVP
jgi:hypothetical protein